MEGRKQAVAVRYDQEKETAPRVVAKGKGHLAEKIIATAKEHGIPIYEDRDLVTMLSAVELFDEIPPELYAAVAEVLVWVYRVNKKGPFG
ncbi:MAG: EscU/YscU/HrcU family type III secretion system export apparatus switch protein [Candidatus Hydrogenedentota bacterium]|nr:MAG: EscU/YscU/HrcU family type III secretion system export apparatus switch protein [Candidatus Hydrogenedentota bacterium]